MENPATWGKAELIVDKAIKEHQLAWDERRMAGLSQVRQITDALRAERLLNEPMTAEEAMAALLRLRAMQNEYGARKGAFMFITGASSDRVDELGGVDDPG